MAFTEFYINGSHGSASNINGGSSSGAPLFSKTNGNWNSSTKVFTVGAGDTLTDELVGHFACVCNDGTTTGAYFARVTAINNVSKTVTLSATATTGTVPGTSATARTIKIGGCWAGMSGSVLFPFTLTSTAANLRNGSGDPPRFNFKGSYSITSIISCLFSGTSNLNGPFISGYSATPGDGGMSIWAYTGASSVSVLNLSSAGQYFIDSIEFKNQFGAYGIIIANNVNCVNVTRCKFTDTKWSGINCTVAVSLSLFDCEFSNCANGVASTGQIRLSAAGSKLECTRCLFRNSVGNGQTISLDANTASFIECVFVNNATPCIRMVTGQSICLAGCVFYDNSGGCLMRDSNNSASTGTCERCVFDGNAFVVNLTTLTANRQIIMQNCGFWNNTTKYDSNSANTVEIRCFDFPASPMVDPANGDYRTRSTVGRNRVDATTQNSSKSLATRRRVDVGIGPSNPFYNGS